MTTEFNTTPQESTSNTDRKNVVQKYGIIAGIVFLVLLALFFIAEMSIPGDVVYGVKTNFIEPFGEKMQMGEEAHAAYVVKQMERRLQEVKKLSQKDSLGEKAFQDLTRAVNRHKETLSNLSTVEGSEIPSLELLQTVRNFADVSAALEMQSENQEHLGELGEYMEDIRRDASNLYKDLIDRYVERETSENVFNLIRSQLGEISQELNDTSLRQETIDDAEVYINRVSGAVAEGNYPRAFAAIAEAMRFIKLEKYGVVEHSREDGGTSTGTTTATTSTSTEETTIPAETQDENNSFTFPE